jgi:hypothetical protein
MLYGGVIQKFRYNNFSSNHNPLYFPTLIVFLTAENPGKPRTQKTKNIKGMLAQVFQLFPA